MPHRLKMITEVHIGDRAERARALSNFVSDKLIAELKHSPKASLALSGGKTPELFFRSLSEVELPWDRVTIVLVDERWVPENSDRSNARTVRENLLKGPAAAARFFPLYDPQAPCPERAILGLTERFLATVPQPFCCTVLGMGLDGHTASWFPDGDHLDDALHPNQQSIILPMNADSAGEPRITFTLPPIASSRAVALLIEGANKWHVYEESKILGCGLPFNAVILSAARRLTVFAD